MTPKDFAFSLVRELVLFLPAVVAWGIVEAGSFREPLPLGIGLFLVALFVVGIWLLFEIPKNPRTRWLVRLWLDFGMKQRHFLILLLWNIALLMLLMMQTTFSMGKDLGDTFAIWTLGLGFLAFISSIGSLLLTLSSPLVAWGRRKMFGEYLALI